MTALSTPTDEWFVKDLRGPRVTLDDESVVEFRRHGLAAPARPWLIAAGILGLLLFTWVGLFSGGSKSPPPPSAPLPAAAPSEEAYEADWESAAEVRDPGFVVEKRELPLEPREP